MTASYSLVFNDENKVFLATGELTFSTAKGLLDEAAILFENNHKLHIDLTDVTRSDSAGLAVLIAWIRLAKAGNKEIMFYNVPDQLLVIAKASGVDTLLPVQKL